jgi:CubicO group peptidase (beta-lactamase class C family)
MDDASLNVSGFSKDKLAAIPPMLQGVVDAGVLSGAVTLLWRNGEIGQLNTLGYRNIAEKAPMQRDTIFRIASMTKPVTSVAALMLLEEGKLKLSDPITKWLPEFKDMVVLKDAEGPLDQPEPAKREITVEDLMTHRSGLAYGFTSIGPIAHAHQAALGDVLNSDMTSDAWLEALGKLPLSYQPGERFHYSHSTDVLGFLVGRIEGKSIRDVLVERIFAPLGMVDTDFFFPKEKRGRMATVYRMNAAGGLDAVPFKLYDSPPPFCGGGGGLVSTVDDYLKFARMLLNKGEVDGVRLLKPETVDLLTENRLTDEQRAMPFFGIPYWMGQGFGLGVSVILDAQAQAWMGAGANGGFGWPGAFGTWWRADPANNMVMLYMIQNSMPLEPGAASQLATGQRTEGQMALPMFQNMVYAAIEG